mgnify:CR=1 FL=1
MSMQTPSVAGGWNGELGGVAQVVVGRTDPVGLSWARQWLAIEAALQDRQHRFAGTRSDGIGAQAGRLQACLAELTRQRQQTQATAVAHLRMRLVRQYVLDQLQRGRPDVAGPAAEALGCPFQMRAAIDRPALRPLPTDAYEPATFKRAKVLSITTSTSTAITTACRTASSARPSRPA